MDRSVTMNENTLQSGNADASSNTAAGAKLDGVAQTAHQTVDKVADKATAQVDRLSGSAHRAVTSASDAARTAAQWASAVPEKAIEVQTKLAESACASIRARPLSTVAGALVIGYLMGRLVRI